jgi:hypothetical protein
MATPTKSHTEPIRRTNSLPELGNQASSLRRTPTTKVNTHVTFDTRQPRATIFPKRGQATRNDSIDTITSAHALSVIRGPERGVNMTSAAPTYLPSTTLAFDHYDYSRIPMALRDPSDIFTTELSDQQRHRLAEQHGIESTVERVYRPPFSMTAHQEWENRRPTPPLPEPLSNETSTRRSTDNVSMWYTKAVNAAKLDIFTTLTRSGDDNAPKTATLNIAATQRLVLAYQQKKISAATAILYTPAPPSYVFEDLGTLIHIYCKSASHLQAEHS